MDVSEKETVVVERGDRSSSSWIIPLAVVVLLILAFFYFGGFNLFAGTSTESNTDTINVDTPDTIQVQPANP